MTSAEDLGNAPGGRWRLPVLTGLLAVAVQAPIFDRWFALVDEGYLLAIADALNQGHVAYRDINIDAPFPGAFYLVAWWFQLAGTSVRSARWLAVGVFVVLASLLTHLAERVVSRRIAVAIATVVLCYRVWAFPHWHVFSYSSASALLLTIAIALLFRFVERRRLGGLVAAGACTGAAIMCKQDYGLAVMGTSGLFLLCQPVLGLAPRTGRRGALVPAAVFSLGVLAVVAPALGVLHAAGALSGLVEQAIRVPLSGAMQFDYVGLPPLRPLLHQDHALRAAVGHYFPSIALTLQWTDIAASWWYAETAVWDVALKAVYYGPIGCWLLGAVAWLPPAVRHARAGGATRDDARRLLLLAWSGGFLLAFNRPRDWVHLMMIYPPTIVVAGTLLADLPGVLRWIIGTPATLALVGLVLWTTQLAAGMRTHFTWKLPGDRGHVYTDPHNGVGLDEVYDIVLRTTAPGQAVPVYPMQPMIGFLTARPPVAGFYVIWPVQVADRDARIIAALDAERTPTIVYCFSQYEHLGRFQQNAPRLFEYLARHYRLDTTVSHHAWGPLYGILRRRPGPSDPALADRIPRTDAIRRAVWPFADVVTTPVTQDGRIAAELPLDVPDGSPRLRLRFGTNPDRWQDFRTGPVTFSVVADTGAGTPVTLLERTLFPAQTLADRQWTEAALDLRPFRNRRVTLRLGARAATVPPDPETLAGWTDIAWEHP